MRYDTHAVLIPEPDYGYDPNAIQVFVEGNLVGYLSRDDAVAYRPGLLQLMNDTGTLVALEGDVVGGGPRPDGLGRLGVFLDHDPTDFGIRSNHPTDHGGFRTGLHEAMATDVGDDSYDLSWYETLPSNDAAAIKQLRKLLKNVGDPIDRHYMMGALETCLYKCREAFASALDEFDDVCRQHDGEMTQIRPALLEKFGTVPLIGTYRQAAIRCQKAHDWKALRQWAERGIAVYGNDADRPEAVEDLHKRLAYAMTKIDEAARPKPQRRSERVTARAPRRDGSEIETLVCARCSRNFQRVRTRGRKPRLCPACRQIESSQEEARASH